MNPPSIGADRRADPRSTEELFKIALTAADPEDDARWDAVWTLRYRETREVLDKAGSLAASADIIERKVAADILGSLGIPDPVFPEECFCFLEAMLEHEADSQTLSHVAWALAHLADPRGVDRLLRLKSHEMADIRHAAATGLSQHRVRSDDRIIPALIELTRDRDDTVRDWATFGLGSFLEEDTAEIRDALAARLTDPHDDTRGEALVGLAKRKDPRVIAPLLRELSADRFGWLAIEASVEIAEPQLRPLLLQIKEEELDLSEREAKELEEAIDRCRPPG